MSHWLTSESGLLYLLRFEFAFALLVFLVCANPRPRRFASERDEQFNNDAFLAKPQGMAYRLFYISGVVLLSLFLANQCLGGGRALSSIGILMPGSTLVRQCLLDVQPWVRRLFEPCLWMLLGFLVWGNCLLAESFRKRWKQAAAGLLMLWAFELLLLEDGVFEALVSFSSRKMLSCVHFVLTQFFLLLLIRVFLRQRWSDGKSPRVYGTYAAMALFPLAILFCCLVNAQGTRALAGVHYYSWFPENWGGGYLGQKLSPPQTPLLGEYHSGKKEVLSQHISWLEEAGVDFLVFDWWPERIEIDRRLQKHLKDESALGELEFSLLYETLDLVKPEDEPFEGVDSNVVVMTEKRAWRLKKHWEYLAKTYMKHPAYLKRRGAAVLYVYASRHIVGPHVVAAIKEARAHVRATTGVELYLIADEAFFNVLHYHSRQGLRMRPALVPDWKRLAVFDAVSSYNPYDESRPEHGGSKGAELFLKDVAELYHRYAAVSSSMGMQFIPGVIPGYNDRGVRLVRDHFVIPRMLDEEKNTLFFSAALKLWVEPFLRGRTPWYIITSWNEWNEATQIEPTVSTRVSSSDQSPAPGQHYTLGEKYRGYGREYLEILRAFGAQ